MMEPKINCIVFVLVALAALAVVKITTSSLKPTEQPVVKRKTFAVLSSQPAVGSFREPISKAETELNLPRPLKIMEQYKALHSVDALTKHPHNRKFAVIFYTCPVQAGNRLHHFTTGTSECHVCISLQGVLSMIVAYKERHVNRLAVVDCDESNCPLEILR